MSAAIRYIAQPFVAAQPDTEVIGATVLAFVHNLEADIIAPILPKHGLGDVQPDQWYSHQAWMDVLKELSNMPDSTTLFVAFGRQVVQDAVMPPEITSIPQVLNLLDTIHKLNLRNLPAEDGYVVRQIGEQHYHVYHNTPNPIDAIYGFIWGLVARFKQPDEQFLVQQIPNPNPDEQPGTVFEVKWWR